MTERDCSLAGLPLSSMAIQTNSAGTDETQTRRWVLDCVLVPRRSALSQTRRARSDGFEQPAADSRRTGRRAARSTRVNHYHPLKIIWGDPGTNLNDARYETAALADVDLNERKEHHLRAALATGGVFIPTPETTQVPYVYYAQLYPPARWKDPVSYIQMTQTADDACGNVLDGEECTYYMDEVDKQWLDKNNRQVRGESGEDKDPNLGGPIFISEDEFELVMALLEKFTDQQVLEGDGPDFTLYRCLFLAPLPANIFMPYTVLSWTPPPARLVCIAHNIYPHWKHRRSLVNGRRIRPSLNYYEKDFSDQAYKCFSKRDTKTPRNTRAFANALLSRETVKKPAVAPSPSWNAGWPLADMLLPLETPGVITRSLLPPSAPTPDPTLQEHNITASSLEPKRPAPPLPRLSRKRLVPAVTGSPPRTPAIAARPSSPTSSAGSANSRRRTGNSELASSLPPHSRIRARRRSKSASKQRRERMRSSASVSRPLRRAGRPSWRPSPPRACPPTQPRPPPPWPSFPVPRL
ncbi:hypothetical protein B0H10DRAFT_2436720 [Mycena sp. CBHHK59/15]|nr:hypothetical protein B0H10DRAFT_2436720 [Mycena sp. CBHHK59/15]